MAFTLEIALVFTDQVVFEHSGTHLFSKDIEKKVFEGSWNGKKYMEIAEENGYEWNYINCDVAFHLWQKLTAAFGERVKQSNMKVVLERHWQSQGSRQLSMMPAEPHYIERPPIEDLFYQELLKPGALVRIKAPHKMGKTKMMNQILSNIEEKQQFFTVSFNLMQLSNTVAQDIDQCLRTLCLEVSRKLQFANRVEEFWGQSTTGPNTTCTAYFDEHILSEIEKPVVLAFDNLDRLYEYPEVADDFLCMLRSWHEEAKHYKQWQRLRIMMVYSTECYLPLNTNRSPFNVGLAQELPEWNLKQVKTLAQQSGLLDGNRIDTADISTLMDMVGGHPHLIQTAFQQLSFQPQLTIENLMLTAPTDAGIYKHHLRGLLAKLESMTELFSAMTAVVNIFEGVAINSKTRFLLDCLGLVVSKSDDGELISPRNKLYHQYFKKHLQMENSNGK